MIRNQKQSIQGFTLVEVLVAVFIFTVIAAGVTALSIYYLQNYSFSIEENQEVNYAQTAMTGVLREIREARISEAGAWPIETANDTSFIFYSDVTNDGRTDRVRLFLENGQLKKGVIQPTNPPVTYPSGSEVITILVDSVDNGTTPLFTYYNGSWPGDIVNNPLPLSNRLLETRFVSVYLRISLTEDFAAEPFELRSGVQIRSLKDNL